jgi:hypothetical protein
MFIACNPNLSHITLSCTYPRFDISALMQHIPSERPLKLEYLSIGDGCLNLKGLVPHIKSLQSFEFRRWWKSPIKTNEWCPIFCKASVFPPTIKVESLDSELVIYLTRHPGVVSLTIGHSGDSDCCDALSNVFVQHSEKLRYLALEGSALSKLLKVTQNRAKFLTCTGIEEMVLIAARPPVPATSRFGRIPHVSTHGRLIMQIFIHRLGDFCPPLHCSSQSLLNSGYPVCKYTEIQRLHQILQDFRRPIDTQFSWTYGVRKETFHCLVHSWVDYDFSTYILLSADVRVMDCSIECLAHWSIRCYGPHVDEAYTAYLLVAP